MPGTSREHFVVKHILLLKSFLMSNNYFQGQNMTHTCESEGKYKFVQQPTHTQQ